MLSKLGYSAIFVAATALVLSAPLSARADEPAGDHLKCRRVIDGPSADAVEAFDALSESFDQNRCRVGKAKLYCDSVSVAASDPSAQVDVEGEAIETSYLCYRAKCRGDLDAALGSDAFGMRSISAGGSRLLCVPST